MGDVLSEDVMAIVV